MLGPEDFFAKKLCKTQKLTKFILDSFPHLSPNMLYKALRQKDIKIDGKRINKDCSIYEGNEILVYIADNMLYPNVELDIIFEDENINVLIKDGNIDGAKEYIDNLIRGLD